MVDQICPECYCKSIAEYECNCWGIKTFWCLSHIVPHIAYSKYDHSTKKINESWKAITKNPQKLADRVAKYTIEILSKSWEYESKISKINKKLKTIPNIQLSYFSYCVYWGLEIIKQYISRCILIRHLVINIWSFDEFPLEWYAAVYVLEDTEKVIESLEKLIEALLLENQVKNHFFKIITKGVKMSNNLKSEFDSKVKKLLSWLIPACFSGSLKFRQGLLLTSELINSSVRANYLFHINENNLFIYGALSLNLSTDLCNIYLPNWQKANLNNREIFCWWNNKSACKIDRKTMKITKILPSSKGEIHSALIYYKECVYLFSLTQNICDFYYLEKYDLMENRKTYLPNPPVNAFSNYSCTIYRDSILFCAKNKQTLYKFDLIIESYSKLPLTGMSIFYFKMVFTGNMKAYVADSKSGIFESGDNNEYNWNKIGEYNYNPLSQESEYLIYLSWIKCDSGDIYKFDLLSKHVYDTVLGYFRSFDTQKYPICLFFG